MEAAEQAYLAARKEARNGTDSVEQPEPVEAVDVLEDSAPIEDTEEVEAQEAETESVLDIEESATADDTTSEDQDLLYYEIDGEEVSLEQLREWRSGGLMQADYTRKTTAHARNVEAFEDEKKEFEIQKSKLTEQLATLEAMVSEESMTDEQLQEMREYEPEKYIEYIEKQNKRKEFLKEAKKSALPQVNVQEEQAKLISANPQWLDNGKPTEEYQKDMDSLTKYYSDNGFTQEQVNLVNQSALLAQAVIDAARFKATNVKKAVVEKRVRKAPVSTKPKAQATNATTEKMKALRAKAQQGDAKAFAQLRQLQREQKGN